MSALDVNDENARRSPQRLGTSKARRSARNLLSLMFVGAFHVWRPPAPRFASHVQNGSALCDADSWTAPVLALAYYRDVGRLLQLLAAPLTRFLGGLRYPVLFGMVALVFVIDLIVPDMIPFGDEILLGLTTLLLASRRKKGPVEDEKADTAEPHAPAESPDDRAID